MNQRRLSNSLICLASIVGMQSVSAAALAIDNAAIASNSPPISVITPTAQPDVLLPDQIHILSLYNQTSKIYPMHIGRLECAPDSAVYVINTLRSTAIFVLDQKNKGDVRVIVNDKTFRALPGEEILLSKVPDKTFVQLNPNLGIPYRGARLVGAVGDVRVFKNEYLMGTAFLHIPHIAKLIDSTDG